MGNIVELCKGCEKIDQNENCMIYPNPAVQMRWVNGKSALGCAFNRKAHIQDKTVAEKKRVGQQKQKKR